MALRKRGVTFKFASERWGYSERGRGGFLQKRGEGGGSNHGGIYGLTCTSQPKERIESSEI